MPRRRLPNRRASTILKFQHEDGVKYTCSFSCWPEGGLAEIFINAGKPGTSANVMARDLALVTSLALQWGVPVSEIEGALEQERDGTPRGPLGQLLQTIGDV